MAALSRTLLSDLPKDHEFSPTTFELSAGYVDAYLVATRDASTIYADTGLVPPLAVAARALGALLDVIELPAGSLHTGQEVDVQAGVAAPVSLEMSGRIAQRSKRAGLIIAVLEFQVSQAGKSDSILTGRTTIMMRQEASE